MGTAARGQVIPQARMEVQAAAVAPALVKAAWDATVMMEPEAISAALLGAAAAAATAAAVTLGVLVGEAAADPDVAHAGPLLITVCPSQCAIQRRWPHCCSHARTPRHSLSATS